MKNRSILTFALLIWLGCESRTYGQGSAFTYQGLLRDGANLANGVYDVLFTVWDAPTGGIQFGASVTNNDVAISNGLFTVTVDAGTQAFNGGARWLQIGVRPGASIGGYTNVSPRQAILPTPYAMVASTISGTIDSKHLADGSVGPSQLADAAVTTAKLANSAVTSAKIVDGSVIPTDLDLTSFESIFWKVNGNAGTTAGANFVGTTDNQPLEVKVNNQRALRLEPNVASANFIAGFSGNFASNGVVGATIGGGGTSSFTNRVLADYGSVGGGQANTASGYAATVGGGLNNAATGGRATIGGGENNQATATTSTVGGGFANQATAFRANVSGGELNHATGASSAIAGGDNNSAAGFASAIGGGEFNVVNGDNGAIPGGLRNTATNYAFAAGRQAKANHTGSFVWADNEGADFASTAPNQFLIRAEFTGINRATPLTANEFFGIRAPVTNDYGGMYVETAGSGLPFYGYAQAGTVKAWTYVDGTDADKWKLVLGGGIRLTVTTAGNVGIGNTNPTNKLHVAGGVSATAFIATSDRHAKEGFAPVSPNEVLDKVARLPITTWNFKELHDGRHMGPTAQDFYAAFGLGGSDTTITTVDPDGVALAAIQGLNQKVESENEALRTELKTRITQLEELQKRLVELEKRMARSSSKEKR